MSDPNSFLNLSRSLKDFSTPRTKVAVESASAVMLDGEITVAETIPESAGNPVAGSKM